MNKAIKWLFLAQVFFLVLGKLFNDDAQFMSPSDLYFAISVLIIPVILVLYAILLIKKKSASKFTHAVFAINLAVVIYYFVVRPLTQQ